MRELSSLRVYSPAHPPELFTPVRNHLGKFFQFIWEHFKVNAAAVYAHVGADSPEKQIGACLGAVVGIRKMLSRRQYDLSLKHAVSPQNAGQALKSLINPNPFRITNRQFGAKPQHRRSSIVPARAKPYSA